jgi:tetratricopeptide (TPR) repeat protein
VRAATSTGANFPGRATASRRAVALTLAAACGWAANAGPVDKALEAEAAGDDATALAELTRALGAAPGDVAARLELARILLKRGERVAEAEHHVDAALTLRPESAQANALRGMVLKEQGRWRPAVKAFEAALALDARQDDARLALAELWQSQGDALKAEAHLRVLAKVRPDWVHARVQLSEVLMQQGRADAAEAVLVELRKERPGSVAVGRALASLYERTGRPKLAAELNREVRPGAKEERRMRALKPSGR